ncbi:MAG: hypothetical protein IJV99_01200 [Clostridia bacterium]|nr:hypothetical protein [Clostridia bacterium]
MRTTKRLRNLLVSVMAFVLVACLFFSINSLTNPTKIQADDTYSAKTLDEITFTMDEGAQIYTNNQENISGIRFSASMTNADYQGLIANEYKSLIFGVIIAPEVYNANRPLNKENLFGENAVYDWADWNEDLGEWEYNGTKTRVINLHKTEMSVLEEVATVKGAITNIKDENLLLDFVGVAYVRAENADGSFEYKMATANDNAISIANIASSAKDGFVSMIQDGNYDDQIAGFIAQAQEMDAIYLDKILNDYTDKGVKAYDLANSDWTIAGLENVTELYDGNFYKVTAFENSAEGLVLKGASTAYGAGEHVFYAHTENGNYKVKAVGATHLIGTPDQLKTYMADWTAENSADDYAVLTSDIDCDGYRFTKSTTQAYKGTFNGLGYAIKNYSANDRGLFGGRMVAVGQVENLALYFTATKATDAVLFQYAWMSGGTYPVLKNLYINLTSAEGVSVSGGIFGGTSAISSKNSNIVIDVTNATIDYALHGTKTGGTSVVECYAIGAPTNKLIAIKNNDKRDAYTETISATQSEFYATYASRIDSARGFNDYWSVKDGYIYFGDEIIVDSAEVKATKYIEADTQISATELLGETAVKAYINGEEVALIEGNVALTVADYTLAEENQLYLVGENKKVVQPFVVATGVIETGSEFKNIIASFYNVSSSAENGSADDYYVLTKDITLPQSGSTAGVWSTDSNWNFEKARFNGLGHTIDCKDVKITGDGIFGDIRFSTIENVAIINATASSGKPIIASNAWGGATVSNVYVECDYQGGNSVGLLLTGEANVKNCVVKTTNVGEGTNYALSTGCKNAVTNCYAIGSVATTTNLTANDNTVVYESDAKLYEVATTNFTSAKGYNSYWQVKVDGVYFGNTLVIAK